MAKKTHNASARAPGDKMLNKKSIKKQNWKYSGYKEGFYFSSEFLALGESWETICIICSIIQYCQEEN